MRFWFALLITAIIALAGNVSARATGPTICVVNHSTNLTDSGVAADLPAFQTAVDRDFASIWNVYAQLRMCPVVAGWSILLVDQTQLAGAAGYHWTRTRPDCLPTSTQAASGWPCAVVGTQVGFNWQVVFSHELFEMLADPFIDRYSSPSYFKSQWHPLLVEVCDPVPKFGYGYWLDGVRISDFVTPAWYTGTGGGRLDFTGWVHHFRHVAPGGYSAAAPIPDPQP